jgi:hypothetical protein
MPAPDTIRRALITLSEDEARAAISHGQDPETAGFLLVDNCQNYHRQRDLRIGRENVMNVGMSGLYMEAPDIDANIFNLADKRKLIAQNRWKDVTVDILLGFLDQADADFAGALHLLDPLIRCIPSIKPLLKEISMRFAATAIETLLTMARKLYRAYGTARGRNHAMHDTGTSSEWAKTVPMG